MAGRPRLHASGAHKQNEYRRRKWAEDNERARKAEKFDRLAGALKVAASTGRLPVGWLDCKSDLEIVQLLIDELSGQGAFAFAVEF